jgi:ribosomal protein L37AE/L43A
VKGISLASGRHSLVCPSCEAGELHPSGGSSAHCGSCGRFLSGAMLEVLRRIVALPAALGSHACECGHPEMRRLPDGVFHCPACGSEVLPINTPSAQSRPNEHSEAYWSGWVDGRFGEISGFSDNPNLAKLEDPWGRLEYYRGHRAGSEARQAASGRLLKAHRSFTG